MKDWEQIQYHYNIDSHYRTPFYKSNFEFFPEDIGLYYFISSDKIEFSLNRPNTTYHKQIVTNMYEKSSIFRDNSYIEDEYPIYHRLNNPAVIFKNGSKYYYHRGLLHREDGPAIISHKKEWFLDGRNLKISSDEEFEMYKRNPKLFNLMR